MIYCRSLKVKHTVVQKPQMYFLLRCLLPLDIVWYLFHHTNTRTNICRTCLSPCKNAYRFCSKECYDFI